MTSVSWLSGDLPYRPRHTLPQVRASVPSACPCILTNLSCNLTRAFSGRRFRRDNSAEPGAPASNSTVHKIRPADPNAPVVEIFEPGQATPSVYRDKSSNSSHNHGSHQQSTPKTQSSANSHNKRSAAGSSKPAKGTSPAWPNQPNQFARIAAQELEQFERQLRSQRQHHSKQASAPAASSDAISEAPQGRHSYPEPNPKDWVWIGVGADGTQACIGGLMVQVPRQTNLSQLVRMIGHVHCVPDTVFANLTVTVRGEPMGARDTLAGLQVQDGEVIQLEIGDDVNPVMEEIEDIREQDLLDYPLVG